MQEVSSKAFALFFKPLAAKDIKPERIVEGTEVSVAALRNTNARIDWGDFLKIMANIRPHFTDAEFVEIGRQHLRNPMLRFVFLVARLRFTPMGFYLWFNDPIKGPGNQLFTCIRPSTRKISETELEVDLIVKDGYEVCRDFFTITSGNFIEMTRLLGYPPAKVELTQLERGGRFRIVIPQRTSLLGRLRLLLLWPFTVRSAGRELQEAHETLRTRFDELQAAQATVELQREVLETAYKVGQRIWSERDPATTAAAIVRALVEVAGFAGVSLSVAPSGASDAAVEKASAGTLDATKLELDLSSGGRLVGELIVAPQAGADLAAAQRLLDLVVPTIAIALDNAFAYRSLADYQKGLEAMVERRTLELSQALEQLREAQGARERFFGNISHEIRTPLSLIMLAAGDIQARAGSILDPRSTQSLGSVTDAARKLVRLVDELLLLAAGQEGKFQVHREPTDLGALVAQLLAAWRPAAEAAGLELEVRAPASLVTTIDPVAIERVASNLISNAVKYTPNGGITLELVEEGDRVRLSVLDTGPGIAEELAKRLFGRFERGERDRGKRVGTGIGLSLVKQIVEAHDGTIEVLQRAPHGTEMRVVLPRNAERDVVAPVRGLKLDVAASNAAIVSGARFDPQGISAGTIVIAEDDPGLAEMTARLLCERYTVFVGLDGAAALELVKKHQPQLLITDIDMPVMNGIELARRFREHTGDRLAPIIMLSAVIDLGTRVAGLEAGAIDYVTKPFDPRELSARVEAQFRMRELAVRLHQAEQLSTLGMLTSGLAHELRNPANGIVNAIAPLADLLPKELIGPETGPGQLLEVVKECAEQIGFLSRQLLGFKSGGQLEVALVRFSDLLDRSRHLAHTALTGVELRIVGPDCEFVCSGPLLIQALTNLVENAGHAAGRGGWVEVATQAQDGKVTIQVSDSGSGVPVALRERIFEPFFTTKSPGKGTGLGLSVSRAIAQRHGGVLEIREHGGRPAFVIEVPVDSVPGAVRRRYYKSAVGA